jgi:hypothetical protein
MMNYFLLRHKNKNYVSNIKDLLLQKADKIVSKYILEQMTQTGASFKYERVVEEQEEELTFYVTSRNCNSLHFNEVEEVICKIVPVVFIEEMKNENINENINDELSQKENNEETSDLIEVDSFENIENIENIENTENTKDEYNTENLNTKDE